MTLTITLMGEIDDVAHLMQSQDYLNLCRVVQILYDKRGIVASRRHLRYLQRGVVKAVRRALSLYVDLKGEARGSCERLNERERES